MIFLGRRENRDYTHYSSLCLKIDKRDSLQLERTLKNTQDKGQLKGPQLISHSYLIPTSLTHVYKINNIFLINLINTQQNELFLEV